MKPPPFRVYIKRLSFIIRLSGGFVVDILNAFFSKSTSAITVTTTWKSRGGAVGAGVEPRSRARRVGARQGGVNGTISSTARAIISPTMRPQPESGTSQLASSIRPRLEATTDPVLARCVLSNRFETILLEHNWPWLERFR